MFEWILSSSVLIAVVILLRFALRGKISLRLQYALWALVLVRLLVPISFGDTAMSVGNLTQKAAASEPVQFVSALSETELPRMSYQAAYNEVAKEYADRGIQIEEMPLEEYAETVDYEIMNKMNGDLSIAEVVKIIWISGIALVGIWFLLSNLRLYRSLKKTRTLLTDSHALPVYLSDAIDTPCLFGLFHPAIYLTSEAIESEHTQRHAVEHELTHYRHKDNIWAILRSVCLAVHWFNPLVWSAAVLSRNDAELSCDESTILRLGEEERASYGRTLIHLTCEKRPALLNTATTMTGSGRSIKKRIALIVKKPKMALYTVIAVVVIAAVAVGCTFTGAKETDTPWNWAQSLTAEDITTSVVLWSEDGESAALSDEETAELVRLLNTLEDGDFTENTELAGSTPTYGLTIQTADGAYNINESIAPSGSLEMSYGDKQWWIDNNDLAKFIQELLIEADPRSTIAVVVEKGTPQAVIDYAKDYVQEQIDHHNELGADRPEGAKYSIIKANISKIEQVSTGTAGLNDGVALYRLEYRLQPDHPENVVMAGGMSVESGWLTEWNSAGQPYLLLHYDDSGSETIWTPICVTNTDVVETDYGTPEMLEKYSNAYTAAAMELYAKYLESATEEALLADAYERALPLLDDIENRSAENTISKDTAQKLSGQLQCDIEFPVKGMDWFVNVTYVRDSTESEWTFSAVKALTYALPSAETIQQAINSILVGALSYDESWQSAGSYTINVSGVDGRTDSYLYAPETFYSLQSTPGYYVTEQYDWTLADDAWHDTLESRYALTVTNDRYSVTVYSDESKMKIEEADGIAMYFVGTLREEDPNASIHEYERLFLYFRQYAMYALEAYELYSCSVDGAETDYEVIARELSEQYARLIPDRPGWYHQLAEDAKVNAANVFDAYYGENNPNFCFRLGLSLKMPEEWTHYWQAGAGLSDPPTSGEFAGYYGYGSEVGVHKSADGRWRMDGFASGGSWVNLPITLEEATTQQLMELYFLTSGHSRDWRILSTLAEKQLAEVQTQLSRLESSLKQELTDGILRFMDEYPDYHSWSTEDFLQ